ncbi:holin [Bacillus phage W.Ph.]|uniref:Gp107 n=1 Tax=Bacillus phage W.Ph. TaxID=764595 RepID=G9B1K8_9CAUD|nr:holin [Bacillus phage W.Ph.]ADH03253.1 gp107 [Bacillus phage W.Ph.]
MENKHEVFVPEEVPAISAGLIVRFVVFAVALINAIASIFGQDLGLTVDQEVVYQGATAVLLLISTIQMAWKNNAVTKAARKREHVAKQIDLTKGETK